MSSSCDSDFVRIELAERYLADCSQQLSVCITADPFKLELRELAN